MIPKFIEIKESWGRSINCPFQHSYVQLLPNSVENYSVLIDDLITEDLYKLFLKTKEGLLFIDYSSTTYEEGKRVIIFRTPNFDSWELVNLIFEDFDGNLFESNKFRVSSLETEKTTYVEYKGNEWENFLGIRMPISYWHEVKDHEIGSYYEITTENTVTVSNARKTFQRYKSEPTFINTLNALLDVFTLPYIYLNGYRGFVNEMPKVENLQADENFSSIEFLFSVNEKDFREYRLKVWGLQNNRVIDSSNNILIQIE